MRIGKSPFLLAAGLLAASSASAAIVIDTVFVGDAGNANDSTGFGAVAYDYYIGTHEVTNSQYTAFLNAVAATDTYSLYNTDMGSDPRGGISQSGTSGSFTYSTRANMGNKPVNFVSFWDAARFANWLTNDQPTGAQGPGTTEDGMYNLGSVTNPTNTNVNRQLNFSLGQNGVAIASENEWYKAAYYDGNGGYTLYPTQSNTLPTVASASATGDISNPGTNVANYDGGADWNGQDGNVTTVGSAGAGSASHYGTFDQGGNVWEWNEATVGPNNRVLRGSSFNNNNIGMQSSNRDFSLNATLENDFAGFRVSSLAPIPEPSAYAAILGCLGLGLALVRRKGRSTL
jgi:hypothetical protein